MKDGGEDSFPGLHRETWLLPNSDWVGRGWSLSRSVHLLPLPYRMSCVY